MKSDVGWWWWRRRRWWWWWWFCLFRIQQENPNHHDRNLSFSWSDLALLGSNGKIQIIMTKPCFCHYRLLPFFGSDGEIWFITINAVFKNASVWCQGPFFELLTTRQNWNCQIFTYITDQKVDLSVSWKVPACDQGTQGHHWLRGRRKTAIIG